jgi:methionyl aminopeptidase
MIFVKNDEEYNLMKKAGVTLAETLEVLRKEIVPGVSADKLDNIAYNYIIDRGARPAFLGFNGYRYTICVSVNNEVIHGLPLKNKILKEGDIVSIDLGCSYKGYFADMAKTFPVGKISPEKKMIIDVTEEALKIGINAVKVDSHIGDIGFAIQSFVEGKGFSVVKNFVGHGIGLELHEEPQVPNFGRKGSGAIIREGMALAIEPMVNAGSNETMVLSDEWTVVTKDGSDSAHFEHTVFVRNGKAEILTLHSC